MPKITAIRSLLGLVAILALLAACAGGDDDQATATPGSGGDSPTATDSPATRPPATATEAPGQPELDGTKWLLAAIDGADIDLQTPITLAFNDGQAGGNAGCNDYGGAYTTSESGDFDMPEIWQTDMACETGMDMEADYLETLRQATQYNVIEDVRLELAGSDGETLLAFSRDEREALDGTSWIMIEFDGELPVTDTHIRFDFRGGEVNGSAGCNDFGGEYTANDEGTLAITNLFWTERGCTEPAGIMEQEQVFLAALAEAESYQHGPGNDTLEITDADGKTRIIAADREEETGSGPFNDTAWVLASLRSEDVESEPPVTIHFVASQFAGTAGCVGYNGVIETEPDGTITNLLTSAHAQPCDDPAEQSQIADEYLATLGEAEQYRMAGDSLEFLDGEGTLLLTYHAALGANELEGSIWTLAELDGEPVITDSEVTAEFSGGYILGSAGCNGYGSPYIVSEPGVISIPPPVMTAMLCEEPSGVMEQETAFHAALGHVRTYRITDASLELLDAGGEVLMEFVRQR